MCIEFFFTDYDRQLIAWSAMVSDRQPADAPSKQQRSEFLNDAICEPHSPRCVADIESDRSERHGFRQIKCLLQE